MDIIKDIPGYKVILKAVLKNQIQQLVEQLAAHTEEESIIITASVADGTLSHLGSDSGKSFLEDHEDVKSQFLGFCLKWHHKRKQENEREEAMHKVAENTPSIHYMPARSPRHISPSFPGPRGQMFKSAGTRHQPYPTARPVRTYLQPQALPPTVVLNGDNQVIKLELDIVEDASHLSDSNSQSVPNSSHPSSPSQAPSASALVKNESSHKDNDAQSESLSLTIPNETLPEGLSLDSNLSDLISGAQTSKSVPQTPSSGDIGPDLNIKLEAITESEMDFEITGVKPSRPVVSPANWTPNFSMGMKFNPSGATGSPTDMPVAQQGYKLTQMCLDLTCLQPRADGLWQQGKMYCCEICRKSFTRQLFLENHMRTHTGEKPYQCKICLRRFNVKCNLKAHMVTHMEMQNILHLM